MRAYLVKTVRSLERGLEVLLLLQKARSADLHELHLKTGFAKATLTRILLTLERRGLIWQRAADRKYHPGYTLKERARHIGETDRVVEAASPVLLLLAEKTGLGAHLAMPRADHMTLCEAWRPHAQREDSRKRIGCRVNVLHSGLGRAYLAFCAEDQRERLLQRLRASDRAENLAARNAAWVHRAINETRRLGYGIRSDDYRTNADDQKRKAGDAMAAIAVPILAGDRAIGSINLVWSQHLATHRAIARSYLSDLTAAAEHIARKLTNHIQE
ncbi:MAG: IclR family transcriptional regulator domain-containing protein [Betaproteobacteria bacterium]